MKVFSLLVKWILIVFVLVSATLAIRRCREWMQIQNQSISYEKLTPLQDGQIKLVLFHNRKRCHQCLTFEDYTKKVLDEHFAEELKDGSLIFHTVTIDEPANYQLVERYGIFAATLVIIQFQDGEPVYEKVLEQGPELYRDEMKFSDYLRQELHKILEVQDE